MYRNVILMVSCIFLSSCSFFDQSYYYHFYKGENFPAIPDSEIDPDGVRTILAGICIEDIGVIDAEKFKTFKARETGDLSARRSLIQPTNEKGEVRLPLLCGDFIRCLTPSARYSIAKGRFPYAAYYNHLILGKDLHRYDQYDLDIAGRMSIADELASCTPGGTAP